MNKDLPELLTRGVEQLLPDASTLFTKMQEKKIRVYLGIDPTAAYLTLGHAVVLRKLQQFADAGAEVILLIGSGTVRIGDPTGRDSTRPELTDEQIQANFQDWKRQASKVLDFDKIEIKFNGDWLDKLTYIDMVKLLAKTTIQQLLERDMFQERMQKNLPIHGHEIIYPLLQGYDSVVMDVDLEIGGSDQLFNMMMGRTLQKVYNDKEKWVLTTPIINGTDGRKMSKSYGNYIALTEEPNDMYGKLMRLSDEMITEYFTILTDLPMPEIEKMDQAMKNGENPMEFKKLLAKTITTQFHSKKAAQNAEKHFEKTVQGDDLPTEMPTVTLANKSIQIGELLKACLPKESNTQLRRFVEQGAVTLLPQEEKPTDFYQEVTVTNETVVKVGKRRYFRIKNKE